MTDLVIACRSFVASPDYFDATMRQIAILGIVCDEGDQHCRHLAARLSLSKPVVTRAANSLGRHGLIERRRGTKDKRDVTYVATAKGLALRDGLRHG